VVVKHKVSIPGYATRTGKRILVQPAFNQRNVGARFTAKDRKWDMYFPYGWEEDDEVSIVLPAGWELDQALAPQSSKLGGVGVYQAELLVTKDGRTLLYKRKLDWGLTGDVLIPAAAYLQVKKAFDFVQEQDAHTITLKAVANAK
jgi:hypothetical protein